MFLVDCHCHLDLFQHFERAVTDSELNNILTIAVTTTPRAWQRNNELALKTKCIKAALGFHPQLVAEKKEELSIFLKHMGSAQYIGEIGLDASQRFYGGLSVQEEVLKEIFKSIPPKANKILSIHSFRASRQVLNILESFFSPEKGKIILHWFTGGISDARRAIEMGCYFSVNSQMGKSPASHDIISCIPKHLLLTETDLPFTDKTRNLSQFKEINDALSMLSDIRRDSVENTKALVWDNFCTLTGMHDCLSGK